MAVVKAWKCDSCGKLIEKKSDVYVLNLKSLPFKILGDPGAEDEINVIELHFCQECARNIVESLRRIESTLGGRVGNVSA